MKKHALPALACALTIGLLAPGAHAEMSPDELARLGKDLTPNGAIMAGNADGSIPAWTGGLTQPPPGWDPKMGYVDPFKDEKPLFTITAANVDSYGDKVSPGMAALLKKYPNQAMPVYKTHRTFANPPEIYAVTKEKAAKTKIVGLGIENYDNPPGTPFPIPKNGVEAIYNHLTRYFGGYQACRDWLPVRSSGDYYRVGFCEHTIQGQNLVPHEDNQLFMFYAGYDAPATLLGTIYLVRDPIDYTKPGAGRQAWIYNAGQRRVRRAPDVAYDNVDDGTEGMRTSDDYWGFHGAIDRYDWKLIGEKEMYIPYNAYRLMDPKLKYADMIDKGSLKPELMRWELHRVHVVEATLKPGMSHILPKRVFYMDEDSHIIALADGYDGRGNLWRVYTYPMVQAYDAGVMFQTSFTVADLSNGNYFVSALTNQRAQPAYQWNVKGDIKDFNPDAMRRRGVR